MTDKHNDWQQKNMKRHIMGTTSINEDDNKKMNDKDCAIYIIDGFPKLGIRMES